MFGATRFTNSSHLLAIEGSKFVKPVRLPPGRAKLCTTPAVSGSLTWTNTVGVVRVVSLTAMAMGVVLDHVGAQIEQFFGELARMHDVARTPAIDELDIAALDPAERVKGLLENHDPRLSSRAIPDSHQYAHPPHAIRRLRARRERPSRSAAQKDHELTPLHSDMGLAPARPGSDHNPPT